MIDILILALIGFSVVLGVWRGFLREAISLAAWVAAFLLAFVFVDEGASYLTKTIPVPEIRFILAFGGLFLFVLFVGGLVNIIVGQIVVKAGLDSADRLMGFVLGMLRGVAIVAILVLLAGLSPLPQENWWHQSLFLPHLQGLALWMRDLLPPEYVDYFNFTAQSLVFTA